MHRSVLFAALGFATLLALVTGCADEDPRFGGAGAIENVHVFDTPRTPADEGGTALSPRQAFGKVWTALKTRCGSCHAPPGALGAPVFFGADEASSYDLFKARSYHLDGGKPATSAQGLVERGVHTGPALSDDATTLIVQWRAAEKAAAGAMDAGDGG
jgi:hypothetical protein